MTTAIQHITIPANGITLHVAQAGHFVQHEEPARVNELLLQHLRE